MPKIKLTIPPWPSRHTPQGREFFGVAEEVVSAFRELCYPRRAWLGLLAHAELTSGLRPAPVGDEGLASGLWGWHPSRARAIAEDGPGYDVSRATPAEQVEAVDWELGAFPHLGRRQIFSAGTVHEAGHLVRRYFDRLSSSDAAATAERTGMAAVRWWNDYWHGQV